eukprot:Platyproteum_vivax@DN2375_c0_g1_i2.p1
MAVTFLIGEKGLNIQRIQNEYCVTVKVESSQSQRPDKSKSSSNGSDTKNSYYKENKNSSSPKEESQSTIEGPSKFLSKDVDTELSPNSKLSNEESKESKKDRVLKQREERLKPVSVKVYGFTESTVDAAINDFEIRIEILPVPDHLVGWTCGKAMSNLHFIQDVTGLKSLRFFKETQEIEIMGHPNIVQLTMDCIEIHQSYLEEFNRLREEDQELRKQIEDANEAMGLTPRRQPKPKKIPPPMASQNALIKEVNVSKNGEAKRKPIAENSKEVQ